jgi:lipopolysaccharide transport system permease protein
LLEQQMTELLIEADHVERQYWRDLWRYRELFFFFTWRDLLVRYKQTVVGISWSVLRPVLTMLVLTVVFGHLAQMRKAVGVPYPLLVLCGMLPWQFFSMAMFDCGESLVMNSSMVSKIYFPRLVMTASKIMTSLVDFLISVAFLAVLLIWYHFVPTLHVLLLPFFMLLMVGVSLGVGLWVAALMVEYRDFRFIVPFFVQFGLYLSPVGYQSNVVDAKYRLFYSLNPMVGIIDGFRWSVLGTPGGIYLPGVVISVVDVILLLVSGIWYFRKTERTFADVI